MKISVEVSLTCDIHANGRLIEMSSRPQLTGKAPQPELLRGCGGFGLALNCPIRKNLAEYNPPICAQYDIDQNPLRSQPDRTHAPR
jgi:hypothetical protein